MSRGLDKVNPVRNDELAQRIVTEAERAWQTVQTYRTKAGKINGNKRNGFELHYRSRLMREAGVEYGEALDKVIAVSRN